MNGQVSQMRNLVISAREALLHNSQIRFETETYIYKDCDFQKLWKELG